MVNIFFSQMDCICKQSQSWKACKTLTDSTSVKLPQHFYANHLPNLVFGNVASKIGAHTHQQLVFSDYDTLRLAITLLIDL